MVSTVGEPVTTALSEITQVADNLPGVSGATNAVGGVTSEVVPGGGLGGAQTRGSGSTTTSTISSGGGGGYERRAVGAGAGVVAVALCVMVL